jgi:TonB family protein
MKDAFTILFFVFFIVNSIALIAQHDTLAKEDSRVASVDVVERSPEYEGGLQAVTQLVSKELKYPRKSRKAGVEGTVFVGFVVQPDGTVADVHIVKGLNKEMNEEVLRVMKKMDKWKPGTRNGMPIKSKFVMPVKCELPKKDK